MFIAPEIAKIKYNQIRKNYNFFPDPENDGEKKDLIYDSKVDVFSLGCMFYLILFGKY